MYKKLLAIIVVFSAFNSTIQVTRAQLSTSLPSGIVQAIVQVRCENRQGSGTVINGDEGYILTNAHVALNLESNQPAPNCTVLFPNEQNTGLEVSYRAIIVHAIYSERRNQDFAILQITQQLSRQGLKIRPMVRTNEFPVVGQVVRVYGYPGASNQIIESQGIIQSFEEGFIQTTAELAPGSSGGTGLDNQFNLVGIPTRIVTTQTGNAFITTYDLIDIRAVFTWLDTLGPNEHDKYFTHANTPRYHEQAVFTEQASLGCDTLARTPSSSAVYCLTQAGDRLVFPTEETFLSWYPDFSTVRSISGENMSQFPIRRNVTFKPGTLVKSATSPQVYVVIDALGSMRWIQTEARATSLFGANWAALVHDIPDEFYANYTVGQPLE